MPLMGLTAGLQPIVGFNYGAGRYERVKRGIMLAAMASTAAASFGFFILLLLPDLIMRIFSNDQELILLGRNAWRVHRPGSTPHRHSGDRRRRFPGFGQISSGIAAVPVPPGAGVDPPDIDHAAVCLA